MKKISNLGMNRGLAYVISFLLITASISGLGQEVSQEVSREQSEATFTVREELDVKVVMRDGVRLSTNIYRPDAEGKFPVLLMRSPYGNGSSGNRDAHYFAQRGYVVVTQDTRGISESEGMFDAFQYEGVDGYDTQQWAGTQEWSNGKIGTYGGSYVGFTQWMIPTVTFPDFHDVVYQDGAFRLDLFTPWSIEMTRPFNVSNESISKKRDSVLKTLPLMEQDRAMGWRISFLRDWLSHPEHDGYWDRTSVGDNYSKIGASVYNIGGWYDILLEGTINNYLKMTAPEIDPEIRSKQKLLIGPWVHSMGKRKVGELDFGEEAVFNSTPFRLRWFDSQLKGMDNGVMEEAPVKIFVMGVNQWRFENEWPLSRTDYQDFYLHSTGTANFPGKDRKVPGKDLKVPGKDRKVPGRDRKVPSRDRKVPGRDRSTLHGNGLMSTKLPGKESSDHFIYDPEDPVPTIGTMGPYDMRQVEERADVLVYTTPPLKKDLEVTGPVKAVVFASSSAVNTDFTAKLVDVYPDGRAIRSCEGIIRADHRDPDLPPSPIVPGEVYEYTIDLWATSNVFLEGHQLRVEISSSNFPRFDRNLNTGNFFATDTSIVKAEQSIYYGPEYPSRMILPVIKK